MKLTNSRIQQAQSEMVWDFGNDILYKMCDEYPLHVKDSVIIGKIWLIGRSYAAAIERGAKGEFTGDDFYKYDVAKKIKIFGSILDKKIAELKIETRLNIESLIKVCELHFELTTIFKSITGKENRSLASKYLHFHLPKLFYIYDSRAIRAVNELQMDYKSIKVQLMEIKNDIIYADFIAKMYVLNEKIEKENGVWLNPREIDKLLIFV